MGLILIPHEKQTGLKKASKTEKKALIDRIRKKLSLKEVSRDEQIVGKTCMKMIQYVMNNDNFSLSETRDLLCDLERSVLSIQRRKKKLVEKKSRRK